MYTYKPVEVITYTNRKGMMKPYKIRLTDETGEYRAFKINSIIKIDVIKEYKNPKKIKYYCSIIVDNNIKNIELLYNAEIMKWSIKI